MATHQTVLILDFGSQFTQLIARRLREQRVYCEVHPFSMPAEEIRRRAPIGIILSGGPQSVYDDGAPHADRAILELGIPVLGICYGMQLVAHLLDGRVEHAARREYGRAEVEVTASGLLLAGLEPTEIVWMSHGDHVTKLPSGFTQTARTANAALVGMENRERGIYCIQFHPEVSHTVHGSAVLRNFLFDACGATGDWTMA
ncbi:MAG: glutamine-hydrolyzing GMP synthase, partial [Thermoanaerobaculia bacterium]